VLSKPANPELVAAVMTLRRDFTFGRLVPIASATHARRVVKAMAMDRADAPRVLILYGPTGTGKTHLLHAVAHLAKSATHASRPLLMSAADLRTRLVDDVRRDQLQGLAHVLEQVDLLLIDDLQALSGMPGTQVAVARLLGGVARRGARVVMASGVTPAHLRSLVEGLRAMTRTRTVALGAPSPDEMRRLLSTFLGAEAAVVRRRVLTQLIRRSHGDIGRLQGAVISLRARFHLGPTGDPVPSALSSCEG